MKNQPQDSEEIIFPKCPFCESNLTKSPSECFNCGAMLFKNYISSLDRSKITRIRVILLPIAILIIIILLVTIQDITYLTISLISVLVISWLSPLAFFKFKCRGKNVWKKKLLPW